MPIYIAAMNMRGKRAIPLINGPKLNVTSCQRKDSEDRLTFSPMNNVPYKDFYNFEAYWQSGKVYRNVDHNITVSWWKNISQSKRRYPTIEPVMYARFPHINENLDYISSRKMVYVPEYYNLIKDSERLCYWQGIDNVTVYDLDGPRDIDGNPICLEVTLEMLIEKINDTSFPFGHGYIVAATLAGIEPESYTNN